MKTPNTVYLILEHDTEAKVFIGPDSTTVGFINEGWFVDECAEYANEHLSNETGIFKVDLTVELFFDRWDEGLDDVDIVFNPKWTRVDEVPDAYWNMN